MCMTWRFHFPLRNYDFNPIERFRKNSDFIHVLFCEAGNLTQYRPPNANLESGSQTVSIVSGEWRHLLVGGGRTWPTWRVSLLTVGMINVFHWSSNCAMQINALSI